MGDEESSLDDGDIGLIEAYPPEVGAPHDLISQLS